MKQKLTELQLAVMQVLWQRGEATVAQVQESLEAERPLAISTIATLLARLERRGVVDHRSEGRQFLYRACISEQDAKQSLVAGFRATADELFSGDVVALVSHLLSVEDVKPEDLTRVKALIEARQRELEGGA